MKKMRKIIGMMVMLAMMVCLMLQGVAEETTDVEKLYKNKDVDDSWSFLQAETVDLDSLESGSVFTISEEGDYVLSGTLNGRIEVEVQEEKKVRLILNGVSIISPEGPAIYEKQADKLIVTLAEGSENLLQDGNVITDEDDTIGAPLYAEDDLSINGSGSLTVNGTQKHGIQSKADLILANGNISITSILDGIRGRNSVLVLDGEITVNSGGDGITTTRTDSEGKGWLILAGGNIRVKTGEGAGSVKMPAESKESFGGRGRRDEWGSGSGTSDSGVSQKAVKAATDLTVLGGIYTFDCADDGLHGVNVTVHGGSFSIQSGDDGMHADKEMTVNAGTIEISQCYEGLEGENVTVNGGDIRIISSDDGINAAGGSDGSGFGGRGRNGGLSAAGSSGMLSIAGGQVAVNADGDGLDSNGSILITGGVIGVWAVTTTGEGPIDFNGTGRITSGTLIVASTGGGRMRNTSGLSGQTIMAFNASGRAGETLTLKGADGIQVGTFIPEEAFDTLMVSSDKIQEGSAFMITSGDQTLYSGIMSNSMTTAGGSESTGAGNGRMKNRKGW